jgi:hypothetical protein
MEIAELLMVNLINTMLYCIIAILVWVVIWWLFTRPKYRIVKEGTYYIPQKRHYLLFWCNMTDEDTTRIYNEEECKGIIKRDKDNKRKITYYE